MLVTRIDESNIHLIMSTTKKSRKRDSEFLNELWQYVLCSKKITRMLPFCKICHERGKFKFEGLGGIKRLGNRVMYIPMNDNELYVVPEIVFHYFYVHKMLPVQKFKEAVLSGPKPESDQYIEMIKPYYYTLDKYIYCWEEICSNCGTELEGDLIYSKGRNKSVAVYWEPILDVLFPNKNMRTYTVLCCHCLHCQEITIYNTQ